MQSELNIPSLLSDLDYFVFFIVALTTLLFIFVGQKRKANNLSESESFMDLMLMGRKLTLPMFVATLVATWYGGIFGVSKIAFENGIFNFVTQGFFWYLTYLIFALFLIKKISKFRAVTLPDLVGQIFGPKSAKLAAVMNILNLVPVVYTISLGLLLDMVFGIGTINGMLVGIAFVFSYSFFGGFRAVVFSDIFQFFVMISSVVLVFILSVTSFGFEVLETLPARYFHPLGGFTIYETLAWGLIALSTLVDPNFYQRCFAAESFKTAKKGIIVSTGIWIIFDLCLTFGAMYAKAMIPDAASDFAYFNYALQLLPNGMRGFFLAGITATILSTLDSYIFLAGSTFAYDLVPKRLQGKIYIHHLGIVAITILSIAMALIFDGNIKAVWKSLGALSSCAILLPVLFGLIFKGKLSDNGFLLSSFLGGIGVIYWRLSGLKYSWNLDEIYVGMALSLLGIGISLSINKFRAVDH